MSLCLLQSGVKKANFLTVQSRSLLHLEVGYSSQFPQALHLCSAIKTNNQDKSLMDPSYSQQGQLPAGFEHR